MMTSTVTPPQPAPVDHERATRLAGIVKDWRPIKDDPDMGNLARAYLAKCAESDARLTSWAECRDLLSKARAEVEVERNIRLSAEDTIGELIASKQAAEASAAKLLEALEEITQWAQAYPLDIFPEPDFVQAHELLKAGGMTLDAVSASIMRRMLERVGQIAAAAKGETV